MRAPPLCAAVCSGAACAQRAAALNACPVPPPRRCARCGLNDALSPGRCCFHPALIGEPGPLLYGPEWHACKAAGHAPTSGGCYTRTEHYYPLELIRALQRAGGGTCDM